MKTDAYEKVRTARSNSRPTSVDYIRNIFDVFFELHGDRKYSDDAAVVAGLAMLGDTPVTVVSIEKGHSTKERTARSFGAPHPEGYRKALRLMKQAEKFGRPTSCYMSHRYFGRLLRNRRGRTRRRSGDCRKPDGNDDA